MKKLILLLGLIVGIIAVSNAQTTPVVRERQQAQTERIRQGVQSNELTRHEIKRLAAEQRHIQNEKKMAKSDGVVTGRERRQIRKDQRKANRNIYRQKHDGESRN